MFDNNVNKEGYVMIPAHKAADRHPIINANLEDFTDYQIEYLKSKYSKFPGCQLTQWQGMINGTVGFIKDSLYSKALVIKKTKDEWYFVTIRLSDVYKPRMEFQCDQWDGLLNLLNKYFT